MGYGGDVSTEEELAAQVEALKAKVARLEQGKASGTRERILGAAREAAHTKGWQTQLDDVLLFAGVHKSTFYVHYGGIHDLLRALAQEIVNRTWDFADALVSRVKAGEDGRLIFLDWAMHGFDQVHVYGQLAVEMCYPEGIPDWLEDVAKWNEMLEFTGYLIKHCKDQGHCREDINVRSAVRVFYTLVSPQHVRWCMREGLTMEQIRAETLDVFFRAHASNPEELEEAMMALLTSSAS